MSDPAFPGTFARLVREYHNKYAPIHPDDIIARIYQTMAQDDRDGLIDADGLVLLAVTTAAITRLIEAERRAPVLDGYENRCRAFIAAHHLTQRTIDNAQATARAFCR